jgi:hypothetical protein
VSRKYVSTDGVWTVEQVVFTLASRGRNGTFLRVTCNGRWIADCRTVADVAQHVDLTTLQLVDE